jgi:hypothetical protein
MIDEASGKIASSKKTIQSLTKKKEELIIHKNSLKNQESSILKHEQEIKKLINDTHDNHLWYAYEKLRLKEEAERNENGKIFDELRRIHDIEILLPSAKNAQEKLDLENEYKGLLQKYFSEEIARDEIALERKMKLRALLNKYIKSIEYFAYGIPIELPSPAKVYRNGKKSTFHYQRQRLTEFVKSKNIFDPELKLTPEQKKKSKLTTQEYLDLFGLKTTQLYRNWNQHGCPKPSKNGATIQDMIDWYKKRNSHLGAKSAKERNNNIMFQKFMSFRVEFSELCAKNTIKYVLPDPQDPTRGVAYKYNKSSKEAVWERNYGDTEIKLKRNPKQAAAENSKIIFAEDDPFFYGKINFLLQRLQSNN